METIGHHSCSNKGGYYYVFENAPFMSIFDEKIGNRPFLGTGYYFWDNNRNVAEEWGRKHYNGHYCILEALLRIENDIFFDLVGSTLHQQMLITLSQKFVDYGFSRDNWQLGKFIEFLKDLNNNSDYHGVFRYKAIRAMDVTPKPGFLVRFVRKKKTKDIHYTDLAPRYIICIISLESISLVNKNVYCVN
jgi:hypothetical protein